MSAAFETARDFAEHGFAVFPVHGVVDGRCTCGKPDCGSPGKHPRTRDGFKSATIDERKLLHWNDQYPDANYGVACGASFSVVDIDSKAGADPNELMVEHRLNAAPIVWTGEALEGELSGVRGAHVYCQNGVPTGNTAVPGVEIRAAGAYVLLPGSRHHSGVAYEWHGDARPWTVKLASVPATLVSKAKTTSPAAPVDHEIAAHHRNTTLTSLGGTMRRRAMSEAAIAAALLVTNRESCTPPLDDGEVRKIAKSVARYKPAAQVGSAIEELTVLLGLDAVGKRVDTVTVYGRGSNAVAHIHLDNGNRIALDPIGRFGTPAKLAQEVALQAGAEPVLKLTDVLRAMSLLYTLGDHIAEFEVEDRARDHGANYLRGMPVEAVDMADQASRWQAFSLLDRVGQPGGPPEFVLEDPSTGLRCLRAGQFTVHVRGLSSPGEADVVSRAMTRIGWDKPGGEGRIKATQPGFSKTLQWAFYTVTNGWEAE